MGPPVVNFTRSGGGYYGFKVHAAACAQTGLPLAWKVQTARDSEISQVPVLVDMMHAREFIPSVLVLDRGYDTQALYDQIEGYGIRPVIPLRKTPAVKAGKHLPPSCEHGTWVFSGSDTKRGAAKYRCPAGEYRCPAGECKPGSVWIKADRLHTLIPRTSPRWKECYSPARCGRARVRHLKHQWGGLPLRVRRLARVRLHIDLTILAQLANALLPART